MKFIENYQDGPYAALALDRKELEELNKRLNTNSDKIDLSDMFEPDDYQIECIRVVDDWGKFAIEAEDPNVTWTTRFLKILFLIFLLLAGYRVVSIIENFS